MNSTVFSTRKEDDMLVTLADIARETGTSISAVSAALKGNRSTAKVSEETRRRVIEEAKRLGYRPSHAARSLKSGRTGIFGFITSEIKTPYYGEIASILMAEADQYEYSVLINATGGNPERQLRTDPGIGALLMWKRDVEPDRTRTHLVGATIRRLHNPGPAPGDDNEVLPILLLKPQRNKLREAARLLVVA